MIVGRPKLITALCIVLGLFGVISLAGGIFAYTQSMTVLRLWSVVSGAVFLVSLIGLWRMKLWGPVAFIALMAANLSLVFVVRVSDAPTGAASLVSLIIPAVYLAIVLPHWSRLDRSL